MADNVVSTYTAAVVLLLQARVRRLTSLENELIVQAYRNGLLGVLVDLPGAATRIHDEHVRTARIMT
jgi:hypothetical protein